MKTGSRDRSGLLAAGNFIIDQVKMVNLWPEQDALATISSLSSSNGGGPYNVLKDLARLGAPFPLAAAGRLGEDANGQVIREDCGDLGIDPSRFIVTPGETTPFTDVMTVKGTGRRTFFYHPGASAHFCEDDVEFGRGDTARFFYLAYLLLLERLDEIHPDGSTGARVLLDRATEAGYFTIVDIVSGDPQRFREVVPPALPGIDLLFLNEFEAGCVLDEKVPTEPDAMVAAARRVLELGVRNMVILHAATGAVAVSREGARAVQSAVAMPAEEVRGAVGAGDAFAAGVIYGLHEGWDTERCLRTGACVAASCLTDPTCSGGVGRLEEALALGERFGFREF